MNRELYENEDTLAQINVLFVKFFKNKLNCYFIYNYQDQRYVYTMLLQLHLFVYLINFAKFSSLYTVYPIVVHCDVCVCLPLSSHSSAVLA